MSRKSRKHHLIDPKLFDTFMNYISNSLNKHLSDSWIKIFSLSLKESCSLLVIFCNFLLFVILFSSMAFQIQLNTMTNCGLHSYLQLPINTLQITLSDFACQTESHASTDNFLSIFFAFFCYAKCLQIYELVFTKHHNSFSPL